MINDFFRRQRVKKYTKLRKSSKYYVVEVTDGLFGRFGGIFTKLNTYIVLARSHREAVERLRKRGISLALNFSDTISIEKWARYKIKEMGKPETHRHYVWI